MALASFGTAFLRMVFGGNAEVYWAILWCNICNERWPISESELADVDSTAHYCPRCEGIGVQFQSLRRSKEEEGVTI